MNNWARLLSSPDLCLNQAEEIVNLINSDGIDYAYYISNRFAEKGQTADFLPDMLGKNSL